MNTFFSNRFFQSGIAITAIGIAFFAYQSFTGENAVTDSNATTEAEMVNVITSDEEVTAESNKVENAVNNTDASDTINTAVEESTTK
jgi:hypothetical protein